MSKREEVVLMYRFASPLYYRNGQENEKFEQRAQKIEPPIQYVIEQEATTQGIRMSKGIKSVFVLDKKL
jgi:hypothetical protein